MTPDAATNERQPARRGAIACAGLLFALVACQPPAPDPTPAPPPPPPPPVDTLTAGSADEAAEWGYRHVADADLDGDGADERVVLAADVAMSRRGAPLWEDGHRWAAYVEEEEGQRTLLYSAFVPNGFVQSAVLIPDPEGRRPVWLQERTPGRVRTLAVDYRGPGVASSRSVLEYRVDEWLVESLER